VDFILAGSAVLISHHQHQEKSHVWFILTNPDVSNRVRAVMLRTRRRHTESTVVLAPGEYPFGDPTVEGTVDYGEAWLFPVPKLVRMIQRDQARMCQRMSDDLLARVRDGLLRSSHTPHWALEYVATNPLPRTDS
jgi:hypothetical protein